MVRVPCISFFFCYISLSTYSFFTFFMGRLGSVGLGFSIRVSVTVYFLVSDIAIFVLKRDVKLQLT